MRSILSFKTTALLFVSLLTCFVVSGMAAAQSSADGQQYSRIIIKWKQHKAHTRAQSMEATDNDMRRTVGASLLRRRGISDNMDGMQLQRPLNRTEFSKALAKLNANPDVEFAVEDKKRFPHALTNDPLITASSNRTGQWYLNDPAANSQWVSAINAITAWNYSTGGAAGSGVIVAVVDTGIRADHPDLAGKILPGRDFINCDESTCTGSGLTYLTANDGDGWDDKPDDPGDWVSSQDKTAHTIFANCDTEESSWHGTRVAGIIGAGTNNGIGIAGIGYNARILPIRALGKCGGYDSDITAGMRWAAGLHVSGVPDNPNPARVINLSLGSATPCDQTYTTVINELESLSPGVSIVASAGNEGAAVDTPASCPGVIGVAGLRNAGTKVGFSSLGPEISVAAPGGNCINPSSPCLFSIDTTTNLGTTGPGVNDYTDEMNYNIGTSFSAPIVSGTIALMLGANSNLGPQSIVARLQASASPFPSSPITACHIPASFSDFQTSECACTTHTCGAGMTNALAAVQNSTQPIVAYIRGGHEMRTIGTLLLDASGSTLTDSAAMYSWSVQSGPAVLTTTSKSSQVTVNSSSAPGTVTLLLTVNDGQGNTATKTYTITVYGPPTAVISGNTNVSANQSITLDGGASSAQDGGFVTYRWMVTSGAATLSSTSNATTILTAPATSGTSTVVLTVTDQEGGVGAASSQITVIGGSSSSSSSAASSTSTTSTAAASSSSAVINGATKGGGALNWEWLLSLLLLMALRCRSTVSHVLRRYF